MHLGDVNVMPPLTLTIGWVFVGTLEAKVDVEIEEPLAAVGGVSLHVAAPDGWKLTVPDPGTGRLPSVTSVAEKETVSVLVSVAVNVAVPLLSVTA